MKQVKNIMAVLASKDEFAIPPVCDVLQDGLGYVENINILKEIANVLKAIKTTKIKFISLNWTTPDELVTQMDVTGIDESSSLAKLTTMVDGQTSNSYILIPEVRHRSIHVHNGSKYSVKPVLTSGYMDHTGLLATLLNKTALLAIPLQMRNGIGDTTIESVIVGRHMAPAIPVKVPMLLYTWIDRPPIITDWGYIDEGDVPDNAYIDLDPHLLNRQIWIDTPDTRVTALLLLVYRHNKEIINILDGLDVVDNIMYLISVYTYAKKYVDNTIMTSKVQAELIFTAHTLTEGIRQMADQATIQMVADDTGEDIKDYFDILRVVCRDYHLYKTSAIQPKPRMTTSYYLLYGIVSMYNKKFNKGDTKLGNKYLTTVKSQILPIELLSCPNANVWHTSLNKGEITANATGVRASKRKRMTPFSPIQLVVGTLGSPTKKFTSPLASVNIYLRLTPNGEVITTGLEDDLKQIGELF